MPLESFLFLMNSHCHLAFRIFVLMGQTPKWDDRDSDSAVTIKKKKLNKCIN